MVGDAISGKFWLHLPVPGQSFRDSSQSPRQPLFETDGVGPEYWGRGHRLTLLALVPNWWTPWNASGQRELGSIRSRLTLHQKQTTSFRTTLVLVFIVRVFHLVPVSLSLRRTNHG